MILPETGQEFVRIKGEDAHYDDRRTDFLAATGPIRQMLLEEQIKLNDAGASMYLLNIWGRTGGTACCATTKERPIVCATKSATTSARTPRTSWPLQSPDAMPEAFRAYGYSQIKNGSRETGRTALRRYLELRPDAEDAEMVRFTLGQ